MFFCMILLTLLVKMVGVFQEYLSESRVSKNFEVVTEFVFSAALLTGFFAILLLIYELVRSSKENGEKLDTVSGTQLKLNSTKNPFWKYMNDFRE